MLSSFPYVSLILVTAAASAGVTARLIRHRAATLKARQSVLKARQSARVEASR
jgi:hypothetical protein